MQLKSGGNGTTNTATNALISFGGNVRLRIVFNYDTNGGAGSASLFLKNLDGANAPFQAVSGLQSINLGLVPTATDARNPKLWNAVGFHIEGATGVLDNFLVDHDTDGDGLADSIENNSRNFLAGTNPGTSPALADTDGDGFGGGLS